MISAEEERDRRRMDAYRAMLRPESNAAESERVQAAKNLADLEVKWPGPPPRPVREGAFGGWGGWGFREEEPPPPPPDPDLEARRAREQADWEERKRQRAAEEGRRDMQHIVDRQRAQVLAIPFWRLDPHLVGLHAAEAPWTAEEHVLFDRRRKESQGGPDRDPAEVGAAITALGAAWAEPRLGELEREWIAAELQRIATTRNRVSVLAAQWIRARR